MDLVSATQEQYTAFRAKYCYKIAAGDEALLPLSFAFLSCLPFCEGVVQTEEITEAQMFIAFAMSSAGGGFDPAAIVDEKILVTRELGREAIVREYELREGMTGTDSISLLRRMPVAYGLLSKHLCPDVIEADGTRPFQAGAYVV